MSILVHAVLYYAHHLVVQPDTWEVVGASYMDRQRDNSSAKPLQYTEKYSPFGHAVNAYVHCCRKCITCFSLLAPFQCFVFLVQERLSCVLSPLYRRISFLELKMYFRETYLGFLGTSKCNLREHTPSCANKFLFH